MRLEEIKVATVNCLPAGLAVFVRGLRALEAVLHCASPDRLSARGNSIPGGIVPPRTWLKTAPFSRVLSRSASLVFI
jgi:hypothetical protein